MAITSQRWLDKRIINSGGDIFRLQHFQSFLLLLLFFRGILLHIGTYQARFDKGNFDPGFIYLFA
jgi:hypothetical protein